MILPVAEGEPCRFCEAEFGFWDEAQRAVWLAHHHAELARLRAEVERLRGEIRLLHSGVRQLVYLNGTKVIHAAAKGLIEGSEARSALAASGKEGA